MMRQTATGCSKKTKRGNSCIFSFARLPSRKRTREAQISKRFKMNDFTRQIGERIRIAREEKKFTQEELSDRLNFSDRQTLSAIETGARQVKPEELETFARELQKPMDYFTDPYVIAETHAFSYRATSRAKGLVDFEQRAQKIVSAARRFGKLLGQTNGPIMPHLRNLEKQTPVWEAMDAGARTAKMLDLGEVPASNLLDVLEQKLRVMVLFVDATPGISGAACRLKDGDFILINRQEPSFRRNFDLGHELFHLLTWEKMPPRRVDEDVPEEDKPKEEKLADAFASGLLIPEETLTKRWGERSSNESIEKWILHTACELQVSGAALFWRMVNIKLLTKDSISLSRLTRMDEKARAVKLRRYSAVFAQRLHDVLAKGLVSTRKAADLLDCDMDELKAILAEYGHKAPFEL
jgi:Zn-dependent peptidase ImmA (M78 family)/transcriptional regulator with XRE-family HTH domain